MILYFYSPELKIRVSAVQDENLGFYGGIVAVVIVGKFWLVPWMCYWEILWGIMKGLIGGVEKKG